MEQIVLEGRRHPLAAEYGGLMYSWHGSAYLGGTVHTCLPFSRTTKCCQTGFRLRVGCDWRQLEGLGRL